MTTTEAILGNDLDSRRYRHLLQCRALKASLPDEENVVWQNDLFQMLESEKTKISYFQGVRSTRKLHILAEYFVTVNVVFT